MKKIEHRYMTAYDNQDSSVESKVDNQDFSCELFMNKMAQNFSATCPRCSSKKHVLNVCMF